MKLKDKVIIVTGSTTGIGEAIARRCVAEGAKVLVHGRNRQRGEKVVAQLGAAAALHIDDLADPTAPARLVEAALRSFGKLDFPLAIITVNVIGSFLMGAFVVFAAHRGLTHYAPFVMTGLLGGFTTFSAFSLETMNLIERGSFGLAGLYMVLSVGLSVGALALGMIATRGVFA